MTLNLKPIQWRDSKYNTLYGFIGKFLVCTIGWDAQNNRELPYKLLIDGFGISFTQRYKERELAKQDAPVQLNAFLSRFFLESNDA